MLAALWGGSFLFLRIASPEFGPVAIIAVRVFTATLLLLPIWYLREGQSQLHNVRQHWFGLLIVGLFNSAIPFVLFAYSTLHITGGMAAILNSTATIWTAVVAWIWLKRTPNTSTVLGLIVGVFGVSVLVADSLGGAGLNGILAAALAAVLYGIAANYSTEKLAEVSSLTIATFSLVAASLVLVPLSLLFLPSGEISSLAWSAVIAMGVLSTALANIIYFFLLAEIGATKTVTVTFMIPVFGTFWGAVFIDEVVTGVMLLGGAIILLAVALVTNVLKIKHR